jgi:hypothetical protein
MHGFEPEKAVKMVTWEFPRQRPMEKHRDPIQGEFFTTESIESVADSVVRESVQNSLDAKALGVDGPVEVRFTVGRVPRAQVAPFLENLWPHVSACDGEAGALERDSEVRFLAVEDFGTTGLRGDPSEMYDVSEADPPNEFYFFVRAEGRSSKSGADRGNWGVGKYTYPMVSSVNAFFALTNRILDCGPGGQGPLAIGQAVLKNHAVDGVHFQPDGWWASLEREGDEDLPLPFGGNGDGVPAQLASAFLLTRRDEPGLSVVVPFIASELDAEEIVESVVRNYGIAIAWGLLTVIVIDETGETTRIDVAELDDVVAQLPKTERDRFQADLELARWGSTCSDVDRVALGQFEGRPSWAAEDLMDEATAQRIREDLTSGRNVCVRVPVHVVEKSGDFDTWSHFDVLFAPTENSKGPPAFYREGLRISEVGTYKITGIRAIVVIDHPPLAQMLGDSEGPAHVNWSPSTHRFKDKYADGKRWIGFVKQAPHEILRLARSAQEDEDRDLARDFFSTRTPPPPAPPPPPPPEDPGAETDDPGSEGPKPEPPSSEKLIRTEEIVGGFSIGVSDSVSKHATLHVSVAYDVRRGSALKKWRLWDFRLEDQEVEITAGRLIDRGGNEMRVRIDSSEEFNLRVRGFDPKRDLYVKAEVD